MGAFDVRTIVIDTDALKSTAGPYRDVTAQVFHLFRSGVKAQVMHCPEGLVYVFDDDDERRAFSRYLMHLSEQEA